MLSDDHGLTATSVMTWTLPRRLSVVAQHPGHNLAPEYVIQAAGHWTAPSARSSAGFSRVRRLSAAPGGLDLRPAHGPQGHISHNLDAPVNLQSHQLTGSAASARRPVRPVCR